MERDFTSAVLSAPRPVIIGARLRPYSLGHATILHEYGCSFLSYKPRFADLVFGVAACANTWRENQKLLAGGIGQRFGFKLWGWFAGRFDVTEASLRFAAYLRDSDDFPMVKMGEGAGRSLSAPHLARVYLTLRELGFNGDEIWDCPLNFAYQLMAAQLERDGKLELANDDFKEMMRRSAG